MLSSDATGSSFTIQSSVLVLRSASSWCVCPALALSMAIDMFSNQGTADLVHVFFEQFLPRRVECNLPDLRFALLYPSRAIARLRRSFVDADVAPKSNAVVHV